MHQTKSRSDARLSAAALFSWGLSVVLVLYSAHGALPFNTMKLPLEDRVEAWLFAPQGWKFFTRSVLEQHDLIYQRRGQPTWQRLSEGKNAGAANWFGLRRYLRAQVVESGLLIERIPESAFNAEGAACRGQDDDCLDSARTLPEIRNVSPEPTICGEIGVVRRRTVPWAWARSNPHVNMPSRVVRVRVRC